VVARLTGSATRARAYAAKGCLGLHSRIESAARARAYAGFAQKRGLTPYRKRQAALVSQRVRGLSPYFVQTCLRRRRMAWFALSDRVASSGNRKTGVIGSHFRAFRRMIGGLTDFALPLRSFSPR